MLEDCLFATPAREHPHPLGALEGSLKGPSLWHFNPPASILKPPISSSAHLAQAGLAPPQLPLFSQGMGEGAEMLEGRQATPEIVYRFLAW